MTVAIGNMTATWASSSNTFNAVGMDVSATSYDANSRIINLKVNGNSVFNVSANGTVVANVIISNSISKSITTSDINVTNAIIASSVFITNELTLGASAVLNNVIVSQTLSTSNVLANNLTVASNTVANTIFANTVNVNSISAISFFGSALNMTGFTANVQQFDTAGANTWTKPTGPFSMALVRAWGGGGSGGRGSLDLGGGGGGGGVYIERLYALSSLGATETMTIGAGGVTRSIAGQPGQEGGTTTFSSGANLLTAYGGRGGTSVLGDNNGGRGGSVISAGGTDGSAGGTGTQNAPGTAGSFGIYSGGGGGGGDPGGDGGNSLYGGAGGGGGREDSSAGGIGGTSVYGGAGGNGGNDAIAGTQGTVPGGGGGGSEEALSGRGANGRVVVITW